MAEQFALEQVFGNGAAIDRDESLVPAARFRVQRLGSHFLARPAFAGDEDARARIGDLFDRAEHGAHDGRLADKAMEACAVLDRLDDRLGRRGFRLFDCGPDRRQQAGSRNRLDEEIERPEPHGGDRARQRTIGGDDDKGG